MLSVALLMMQVPPAPPPAGSPLPSIHGGPAPMTCPVGGEHFEAWRPAVWSTYGSRPDGKPYSYLQLPFPMPECPSNHLAVFDTFTEAEVARLATLIASPDYARLVAADTAYYRASWLAGRLGRPTATALSLLLEAIWQVTPGEGATSSPADRERSVRYAREFAGWVEQLPATAAPGDLLWTRARAANALRQLGEFDRADRMRRAGVAALAGKGIAADDLAGWRTYLDALGPVIARRDASVEPLDMIPKQQAANICVDGGRHDAFAASSCAGPALADDIARIRGAREQSGRQKAAR